MTVLLAILMLAPHVSRPAQLAAHIERESSRARIDPLLVAALIHHETGGTWRRTLVSRTSDYGLLQVHVSSTTNPDLIGREHLLFRPRLNIRRGVRLLRAWKRYHDRHCSGGPYHLWWGHYKWGRRIKGSIYARKVHEIYRRLRAPRPEA